MSSEAKFWAIFWAIMGPTVCVLGLHIKGCNDSDNAMIQQAVQRGCSAYKPEHEGWHFDCSQK